MVLTWKNFFDEDLSDEMAVLAFLQSLDVSTVHYQIAKDILKETIRVHPHSSDLVRLCLSLVENLLLHLTTEDMEDWMMIATDSLDILMNSDANAACYHMLRIFAKAKPKFTSNISPFIRHTSQHNRLRNLLVNALPFFVDIISMGSVNLSDEDYLDLIIILSSALELLSEETEHVQSACFLLRILREKNESAMVANDNLAHAFLCALKSQKSAFGGARVCLSTFKVYFSNFEVFTSKQNALIFGEIAPSLFQLFEENLDGTSISLLLQITMEFLSTPVARRFEGELEAISSLLLKYTDLEYIQDELMLSEEDSELFLSSVGIFRSKLDGLKKQPLIEITETVSDPVCDIRDSVSSQNTNEQVVLESLPPRISARSDAVDHESKELVEHREEFHRVKSEVSYKYEFEPSDSSSPLVEIEESKIMEMLQLIRHFQEHASVSFHRAELLHSLFLESSRKVEELLKENVDLRQKLEKRVLPSSPHKSSISASHAGLQETSSLAESDSVRGSLEQSGGNVDREFVAAKKVVDSERKVLRFIFDGYANRGCMSPDGVGLFARDFGLSPALMPSSHVSQVYSQFCDHSKLGLDFDMVISPSSPPACFKRS